MWLIPEGKEKSVMQGKKGIRDKLNRCSLDSLLIYAAASSLVQNLISDNSKDPNIEYQLLA